MKLFTDRLILRDPTAKDAQHTVQNINNLKISQYLRRVPYPYGLKDAKSAFKISSKKAKKRNREDYHLVIELKSEKKVIGGAGFTGFDRFCQHAEIGYWLGEKYWKQGFASEALESLIRFAFKKLKVRRLQAEVFRENKASVKLLKKFGFVKEGLKRQSVRAKATGKWHDTFIYALLKSDCKI
jgi:ribosomal-protein-alanine N-acetyltransferase